MTGSEPCRCALGLCFPAQPVYRATLGDSAVPMGFHTYSFCGLAVNFFFDLQMFCGVNIGNIFALLTLMSRSALMLLLRITAWF